MINAFILQHKPFTPQIVANPQAIRYIVIDLFCGAGGTTTGFTNAKDANGNPIAIVAACVNHDHKAIRSHWENHPEVYHFEEDIRLLDLTALIEIVAKYRELYPWAKIVLWASLECTNFSKAKGGQSRDADSRTLADHLDRYVIALDPDYVQIENVVEFMSWGPLNEKGKPVSMKSGRDWLRWREHINSLGYRDEWRELNSADFGAYTSRNRLFGCFAKKGLPIVWPEPTHSKTGSAKQDLFGSGLKKWMPVRDLLDFEDEGESIFTRKKPLVENSLKRVYDGLIKVVAGGKRAFLTQYNSGKDRVLGVDRPCNTLPTENRFALAQTYFLTAYYGNEKGSISINDALWTIPTRDTFSINSVNWISRDFTLGGGQIGSVEKPIGSLTTVPKANLVTAGFIYNPSHGGHTMHIEQPCPTIIARQDKSPLYFIQYDMSEHVRIEIYEDDSETMIKIKEFMAMYGISDIKMRMLKVSELKLIQGFPADYKLYGNQSDQKKFIGNSVVPHVVQAWAECQIKEIVRIAA